LVVYTNPEVPADVVEFATVGGDGGLNFWRIDRSLPQSSAERTTRHAPTLPPDLIGTHWVTAAYTDLPIARYEGQILLLGGADGSLCAYDPKGQEFLDCGAKRRVREAAVGCICVTRGSTVVVASADGSIYRYPIRKAGGVLPDEAAAADPDAIRTKQVTSDNGCAIVALAMDLANESGICGTSDGSLHYFTFEETGPCIPLVRKLSPGLEKVSYMRHVPDQTANVLLAAMGEGAGSVKLYTAINLDEIVSFDQKGARQEDGNPGPVACVLMSIRKHKAVNAPTNWNMVVYRSGFVKLIVFKTLKNEDTGWNIPDLEPGEEITCGAFSPQCHNFALGTSRGNIYLGNYQKPAPKENKTSFYPGANTAMRGQTQSYVLKAARITGLVDSSEHAVTSISMSTFTPEGTLLVAYDNGTVRMWRTALRRETIQRLQGRNCHDLAAISYVQFNLDDELDMIRESRPGFQYDVHPGMEDESDFGELAAYAGKKIPPDSSSIRSRKRQRGVLCLL
jgi:WD40 repeat protein